MYSFNVKFREIFILAFGISLGCILMLIIIPKNIIHLEREEDSFESMREFMDKEYKNDELERLRLYRNSPLNEEASGINDIQDKAVLSFNHDHEKDETSVGKAIRKKVRILCWIMTHTNNTYKKAINIAETWGKKCTKLIFISVDPKSNLTTVDLNVPDGRNFLWQKTKKSFKYLYENELNNYDWFLKADDDSFFIIENLRYMLLGYSPKTPVFFGCRFKKYLTQGYNSGAGYILSREALKRFVEIALKDPKKCKRHDNGAEDLEMGRCLQNVGVVAGDSRDSLGRHRMVPFDPLFHLRGDSHNVKSTKTAVFPKWFYDYMYYNYTDGNVNEVCSDTMISFHYVNPSMMHALYNILYHIRPIGLRREDDIPIEDGETPLQAATKSSKLESHKLQKPVKPQLFHTKPPKTTTESVIE